MYDALFAFKPELMKAFMDTMDMMFAAMLASFIIGLLIAFLLFITRPGGIYENRVSYFILSGFINITRSVPFILFIIVFIPINRFLIGTGFGVNASKIPLGLIGIATFARLAEQSLLDVDRSIYETSYSLGANTAQYFTNFLLVEARSGLVLSFTSTTISLIAYSTVMGIIGGGGLGYLALSEGYYNFNYPLMWVIIIILVLIVQVIQTLGNGIAKIIDKR